MDKIRILSLLNKLNHLHNRKKTNTTIADGKRVIETILESSPESVEYLLVREDKDFSEVIEKFGKEDRIIYINSRDEKEIKITQNPQGIYAIIKPPEIKKIKELNSFDRIIFLYKLQDPINVGIILRTALGFGWNAVCFIKSSVRMDNPKLIRTSSGYIYKQNIFFVDDLNQLFSITDHTIIIANQNSSFPLSRLKDNISGEEKLMLVLGNEGRGIDEEFIKSLNETEAPFFSVRIETEDIESLNVSTAGAIMMYELRKVEEQS